MPVTVCLQGEKEAAEQQHRAAAGHLQESVNSLEAKLQAQRDLTDSHIAAHAREVADLKSKLELAQVQQKQSIKKNSCLCTVHRDWWLRSIIVQINARSVHCLLSLGPHWQMCQYAARRYSSSRQGDSWLRR